MKRHDGNKARKDRQTHDASKLNLSRIIAWTSCKGRFSALYRATMAALCFSHVLVMITSRKLELCQAKARQMKRGYGPSHRRRNG